MLVERDAAGIEADAQRIMHQKQWPGNSTQEARVHCDCEVCEGTILNEALDETVF